MLGYVFKKYILPFLISPSCISCKRRSEKKLCRQCESRIRISSHILCSRCGQEKYPCCEEAYPLATVSRFSIPEVRNIIHALKYKKDPRSAEIISLFLVRYFLSISQQHDIGSTPWVVTPIPLHILRERKRGFNQAEKIASGFASHPDIHLDVQSLLIRKRATPSQTTRHGRYERKKNLKNAFEVVSYNLPEHILLVDDVFTTGATMDEAVQTLKQNGARNVLALVFAKT